MSYRLILLDVQLKPIGDEPGGPNEATVALSLRGQRVVGRHVPTMEDGDSDLIVIAAATLDAVQQALPVSVELILKSAIKLTPQFLDSPLLVVIVDLFYGKSHFELTGACQCDDVAATLHRGIAQAALDATNRLVNFIFEQGE
jgi:hypothetical protein